ncbi:unnamed protein product, partial [Didymodactylos carnosus]
MLPSSSSSIEFKLYAPNSLCVSLIGSFSEWSEIEMQKTKDDGQWRVSIALEDGEYEYRFRLQPIKIKDKQAVHCVDFENVIDPYSKRVDIRKNVGIIKIKNGKEVVDEYQWKHDNEQNNLPQNKDLIIYEIFIADFTKE